MVTTQLVTVEGHPETLVLSSYGMAEFFAPFSQPPAMERKGEHTGLPPLGHRRRLVKGSPILSKLWSGGGQIASVARCVERRWV